MRNKEWYATQISRLEEHQKLMNKPLRIGRKLLIEDMWYNKCVSSGWNYWERLIFEFKKEFGLKYAR